MAVAGSWWQTDWVKLANIGQAYGAASAVFSALAVVGVAGSIVYQARQLRLARMQSLRAAHRDLIKQIIEEPEVFAPAVGYDSLNRTGIDVRQHLFITSYMGHLVSSLDTGFVSEQSLRSEVLRYMFQSPQVHRWWEVAAPDWANAGHEIDRRFGKILKAAHEDAKLNGYPRLESPIDMAVTRLDEGEKGREGRSRGLAIVAITAGVAGALVGWFARR
ncbi:DUF6082 family protein [Actinoplanes sp. NPDC004185]